MMMRPVGLNNNLHTWDWVYWELVWRIGGD